MIGFSRIRTNTIAEMDCGSYLKFFLIKYAVKKERNLLSYKSVSLHFSISCIAAGVAHAPEGFTLSNRRIWTVVPGSSLGFYYIFEWWGLKGECNRKLQSDRYWLYDIFGQIIKRVVAVARACSGFRCVKVFKRISFKQTWYLNSFFFLLSALNPV